MSDHRELGWIALSLVFLAIATWRRCAAHGPYAPVMWDSRGGRPEAAYQRLEELDGPDCMDECHRVLRAQREILYAIACGRVGYDRAGLLDCGGAGYAHGTYFDFYRLRRARY